MRIQNVTRHFDLASRLQRLEVILHVYRVCIPLQTSCTANLVARHLEVIKGPTQHPAMHFIDTLHRTVLTNQGDSCLVIRQAALPNHLVSLCVLALRAFDFVRAARGATCWHAAWARAGKLCITVVAVGHKAGIARSAFMRSIRSASCPTLRHTIRAHARVSGSTSVLVLEGDVKFARAAEKRASPAARGAFVGPVRGASSPSPGGTSDAGAGIRRSARLSAGQREASVTRGTFVKPVLGATDAICTRSTDAILTIAHL